MLQLLPLVEGTLAVVLTQQDLLERRAELGIEDVVEDWIEWAVEVSEPQENGVEDVALEVEDGGEQHRQEEWRPAEQESRSDYREDALDSRFSLRSDLLFSTSHLEGKREERNPITTNDGPSSRILTCS